MNPVPYPYIDDLSDEELYVLSTLGKGPKGEKGDDGVVQFPTLANPVEWDIRLGYAAHTMVMHNGFSYISVKDVPHGIDIENTSYWVRTSDPDAQVELMMQELEAFKDDHAYYDEITVETGRMDNTDYYIAHVPKYDFDGNIIEPHVAVDTNLDPLEYAGANGTTLTVNACASILMANEVDYRVGITIGDGVVLNSRSFYNSDSLVHTPLIYERYVGIKADRSVVDYFMNSDITPDQMIADGCVNVFSTYCKIVDEGVLIDFDTIDPPVQWNTSGPIDNDRRGMVMLIGVTPDGDLYFMTCDGRTNINAGLTYRDAAQVLMDLGCTNVYHIDGGGSSAIITKGSKINRNWDDDQTHVRNIHYTLNFKKPSLNVTEQKAFAQVGIEKQRIIEQLVPYINEVDGRLGNLLDVGSRLPDGSDLNDIYAPGKYYVPHGTAAGTMANSPVRTRGYTMFVLQVGKDEDTTMQVIVSNNPRSYWIRTMTPSASVYYDWVKLPTSGPIHATASSNGGTYDIKIAGSYPFIQVIWAIGATSYGMDFLYVSSNTLVRLPIIPTNVANRNPSYSLDTSTKTITIENNNGATFRALVVMSTVD